MLFNLYRATFPSDPNNHPSNLSRYPFNLNRYLSSLNRNTYFSVLTSPGLADIITVRLLLSDYYCQILLFIWLLSNLSHAILRVPTKHTISKSSPCSSENRNILLKAGTYKTRTKPESAPTSTYLKALFSEDSVLMRLWDQERFATIKVRFAITSVAKVSVRASASPLPICKAYRKTAITPASILIPCTRLRARFFLPNILSCKFRGDLFIIFFSSGSASKTVEQAGSIINSRNAMCAGKRTRGKLNNIGNRASPAIGMWTENIYPIAFLRLSKIRLPILTAATMEKNHRSEEQSMQTHELHPCPFPPSQFQYEPISEQEHR